jgi:hypothetical protein
MPKFYFILPKSGSKEPTTGYAALTEPYPEEDSPDTYVILCQNVMTGKLVQIPVSLMIGEYCYTEDSKTTFHRIVNNIGE